MEPTHIEQKSNVTYILELGLKETFKGSCIQRYHILEGQ